LILQRRHKTEIKWRMVNGMNRLGSADNADLGICAGNTPEGLTRGRFAHHLDESAAYFTELFQL